MGPVCDRDGWEPRGAHKICSRGERGRDGGMERSKGNDGGSEGKREGEGGGGRGESGQQALLPLSTARAGH